MTDNAELIKEILNGFDRTDSLKKGSGEEIEDSDADEKMNMLSVTEPIAALEVVYHFFLCSENSSIQFSSTDHFKTLLQKFENNKNCLR